MFTMNNRSLSLDTIPPIMVPLRFFLTAPWFGIIAALLILFYGPEVWASRWGSSTLALTHALTIGFMLMVMVGALYQFIPVMVGQLIPGTRHLAPIIHVCLMAGSLFLLAGFLTGLPLLFILAFIMLAGAMSLFTGSLVPLLIARLNNQLIVYLLRTLFIVLALTVCLGLYLALGYGLPDSGIVFRQYTDVHVLWGLLGWVVLLIMAVSSQVIPMFFVTPEFSDTYLKLLSLTIVLTLLIISLLGRGILVDLALSLELLLFVLYTLNLMNQRKRKIVDVTINFMRLALISLFLVICFWWLMLNQPDWVSSRTIVEFITAVLLIYGLAFSAIIGMLQKIVPFLIFLHLQRLSFRHPGSMAHIPNMKEVIAVRDSRVQFLLHVFSLILLLASVYLPIMAWSAGLMMLASFSWLAYTLYQGFSLFKNKQAFIGSFPEISMNC